MNPTKTVIYRHFICFGDVTDSTGCWIVDVASRAYPVAHVNSTGIAINANNDYALAA